MKNNQLRMIPQVDKQTAKPHNHSRVKSCGVCWPKPAGEAGGLARGRHLAGGGVVLRKPALVPVGTLRCDDTDTVGLHSRATSEAD